MTPKPAAKPTNGNAKKILNQELYEAAPFVKDQDTLLGAESRALNLLRVAEKAEAEARKRQAERNAACIKRNLPLPTSLPLPEARKVQQCVDALVEIRQQIAARDPDLLAWYQMLKAAHEKRAKEVIHIFMATEFVAAQKAYARVLRQAAALRKALDTDGLESCFTTVPEYGDWEKDPEACLLHKQYSGWMSEIDKLREWQGAAEARVLDRERSARFKSISPDTAIEGKFRVVKEFTASGRHFEPGEILDRFDVAEGTLRGALMGQPLGQNKIRRLSVEEELAVQNPKEK